MQEAGLKARDADNVLLHSSGKLVGLLSALDNLRLLCWGLILCWFSLIEGLGGAFAVCLLAVGSFVFIVSIDVFLSLLIFLFLFFFSIFIGSSLGLSLSLLAVGLYLAIGVFSTLIFVFFLIFLGILLLIFILFVISSSFVIGGDIPKYGGSVSRRTWQVMNLSDGGWQSIMTVQRKKKV
ncbi:hypothetical protein BGZ63DRAFT_51726 [Mariannaea sp. PMI_226]|nr:hypothetical protein BGZ63DRAFT_51726 [Mariannaea sp. PMI_226]